MRRSRHFGCRDAACAIKGRKHLGQADHFSADRGVFFQNCHLKALIAQIQGRLQAGNPSADNQCIKL